MWKETKITAGRELSVLEVLIFSLIFISFFGKLLNEEERNFKSIENGAIRREKVVRGG